MKKLVLGIVLAVLFGACGGGNNETSEDIEGLVISVQTLTYRQYYAAGKIGYNYTMRTEYEYDSKGNLIEKREYNETSLLSKTEYEYDFFGNLIKENVYNANGSLHRDYEYEYDSHGNLTKRVQLGGTWYTMYEYDSNGNLIKESEYSPNGTLAGESTYTYRYIKI